MTHALIIDDNMVVSRAIQERLTTCGVESFDHAWTERQALDAAERCRPDLIVVGDHIVSGSPVELARELSSRAAAPILGITTGRYYLERSLPEDAIAGSHYPLSDFEQAITCALPVETIFRSKSVYSFDKGC